MIWIDRRYNEAIPECLYYEGWITDKDSYGQTPLMIWVKNRKGETIP